jgi:hypothetical protein
MQIEPRTRVTAGPKTGRTTGRTSTARAGAAAEARAVSGTSSLVAIEPVVETRETGYSRLHRTNAAFLAQLIATRDNMPQTRARRRAAPAQAIEAYRTTERQPRHMDAGRVLAVSR